MLSTGFLIGLGIGLVVGFAVVGIMLFSFQYWGLSWIYDVLSDNHTGIMWNAKDKEHFINYYKKNHDGKEPEFINQGESKAD